MPKPKNQSNRASFVASRRVRRPRRKPNFVAPLSQTILGNSHLVSSQSNLMRIVNSPIRFSKTDMPDIMEVCFNYIQHISFSSVSTPQAYIFRGNGPYDPNQTGGSGGSVQSLSSWAVWFSTMFVRGSRIEVEISNTSSVPVHMAVVPTIFSNLISSYDAACQTPYNKICTVSCPGSGGNPFKTITSEMGSLYFLNVPYQDNVTSSFSANATDQWFWSILLDTMNQSSTISGYLKVRVYYDVVLFDRKAA